MDLILDGKGIHNNRVSGIFKLTDNDTFVIGMSGKSHLDALTLYRVNSDGNVSPSFWYELFNMNQKNMTMEEYIAAALEYFTAAVQRYFDDETEPEDIYDQLAGAVSGMHWNVVDREFGYTGE